MRHFPKHGMRACEPVNLTWSELGAAQTHQVAQSWPSNSAAVSPRKLCEFPRANPPTLANTRGTASRQNFQTQYLPVAHFMPCNSPAVSPRKLCEFPRENPQTIAYTSGGTASRQNIQNLIGGRKYARFSGSPDKQLSAPWATLGFPAL